MTERARRSALYMPASNPRAIAKARGLDCDVVILDLEDAVSPEAKDEARSAARGAVEEGGFGHRELVVRVNGLDTPWGETDCRAIAAVRPDAVLLPKVDDAGDVARYADLLPGLALWAMVETPRAILRPDDLACSELVTGLVMGTNDIVKDLGMRPGADRAPLLGFLANSVAAARLHRCAILDGVYNAIDDAAGFAQECAQAVAFGFDGKTLIHPGQVEPANRAFSPGEEDIVWARRVTEAFAAPDAADKGALRVDGKMVERLHLVQANRILARGGELVAAT